MRKNGAFVHAKNVSLLLLWNAIFKGALTVKKTKLHACCGRTFVCVTVCGYFTDHKTFTTRLKERIHP